MSDDLLDEATRALREEMVPEPEGEETLAEVLDHLAEGRGAIVDEAARALREQDDSVRTSDAKAERTLKRILSSLDGDRPREAPAPRRPPRWTAHATRWMAAALVLLAIGTGAPTIWAWWNGRPPAWAVAIGLGRPAEEATTHAAPTRNRPAPPPAHEDTPVLQPAPLPLPQPTPSPAPAVETPTPTNEGDRRRAAVPSTSDRDAVEGEVTAVAATSSEGVAAADESEAPDDAESRRFESAHHTHFGGGSPANALAAWDAYLAEYPHGRYEPEARYNRGLALVRLGRLTEARDAIAPFAEGRYGAYRRTEARALVDALETRIGEQP